MNKILLNIGISLVISVLGTIGVYKYLPLSWIDTPKIQSFGSTITTIQGTDTISSSRSVINTNFANLNADKIQSGNTVAALTITTGTIGTLSLTNALTAANGGTGSTTLSSNQILLGNGTGNIGLVSGYGTSGQFLTSNGNSNAPTWTTSAIDQTIAYNFTGTNFLVKNLYASSTSANPINLNGISLNTPSTQSTVATSTLVNDKNGNLIWYRPDYTLIASTTLSSAVSTTTLSLPSGVGNDLKIVIFAPSFSGASGLQMQFNSDTAANYGYIYIAQSTGLSVTGNSVNNVVLTNATNANAHYFTVNLNNNTGFIKTFTFNGFVGTGSTAQEGYNGSGTWNNNGKITSITVGAGLGGATLAVGTRISVYSSNQ